MCIRDSTGAGENAGFHVVNVCANDVASMGAKPMFFLSTIIMPKGTTEEELERVSKDIERAAKEIGVSIVGGHTEISSKVSDLSLIHISLKKANIAVDFFNAENTGYKNYDNIIILGGPDAACLLYTSRCV